LHTILHTKLKDRYFRSVFFFFFN